MLWYYSFYSGIFIEIMYCFTLSCYNFVEVHIFFNFVNICTICFNTPSVGYARDTQLQYNLYLQYIAMLCCCALSFVQYICLPVHVHICPLLFLEVTSSTLEMAFSVDWLPVGAIWVAPSHDHVIVATWFPPSMVHVRVTLLPSIIGPTGVCVIVADVVDLSKIKWHLNLQ